MKDILDKFDISKVGALLADPARAAIIVALCGEHALPASELAECAGISASTTSIHLTKLMEAGWIELEPWPSPLLPLKLTADHEPARAGYVGCSCQNCFNG